jgi:two-component system sensor histidine kinase BaeS
LLDDLQTLSLAESGALVLRLEPISLAEFIADVANACRARIEAAGIVLRVTSEGDGEIYADPFRLRQVLENLVTNAVRHTPAGGTIAIEAAIGEHTARIDLRDTGAGIAPDVLPYIFDRFTKSADSGGSGLGLAIARRLVEAHGGRITAWSQPGAGTRITIALPIGPIREPSTR